MAELKRGDEEAKTSGSSVMKAGDSISIDGDLDAHLPRNSPTVNTPTTSTPPVVHGLETDKRHNFFNEKELRVLSEQFREISRNQRLDRKEFRSSLGIFGMVRDSLICDRLFDVFCVQTENTQPQEYLTFEQYTTGLGIMVKGSVDQKLDFGFDIIDIDSRGSFSIEDLNIIIQSLSRIFSGIMGQDDASVNFAEVQQIFHLFDTEGTGRITRAQFKNTMYRYPEMVLRFGEGSKSRTERAMSESTKRLDAEAARATLYSKTLAIVENELGELKSKVEALGQSVQEGGSLASDTTSAEAVREAVGTFVSSYSSTFSDIESTLAATVQRADMLAKATKAGPGLPRADDEMAEGAAGGTGVGVKGGGGSKSGTTSHMPLQRIVSVGSDHFDCLDEVNLSSAIKTDAHPHEVRLMNAMIDARSLRDARALDEAIEV